LAIEQGPSFAAAAAQATLLGLIGVATFCVGYHRAARGLRWAGSCALGLLCYALCVVTLATVSLSLTASLGLVIMVLVVATRMVSQPASEAARRQAPKWDLPLRMIAATGMVLLITAAAEQLGPAWSGLLSPFPVFASVMAVFSHRMGGPQEAALLLRGVVIGSFAFASFFVVVAATIENWGIIAAYSLAVVCALAVNGTSLMRIVQTRPLSFRDP
jgi:hypothetical protein